MTFNYLGIEINSNNRLTDEITHQANNANKVLGCLNNTFGKTKN